MAKRKVLLIADERGWAFDQNLRDMAEYCGDRFDFDFAYASEFTIGRKHPPQFKRYDAVFCVYHNWGIDHLLPWDRTLGAMNCQWLFTDRKRPPQQEEFDLVNKYVAFRVVTQQNYEEYHKACPRAVYLTNPINMKRFPQATPARPNVVVAWNGNARHKDLVLEDVKGFMSIIQPACKAAGVPLVSCEYHTNRRQPSDMPAFYQEANVALCASVYEGASNSIMEAMASGLAVLATDCGNHREMRDSQLAEYGETGIMLVERTVTAFSRALVTLKANPKIVARMGDVNRREIQRAWSWDVWAQRYTDFLSMVPEVMHSAEDAVACETEAACAPCAIQEAKPTPATSRPHVTKIGHGPDLSTDVTLFFITTGDAVAEQSWAALEKQDCTFAVERVENVAPMSAAFQQMLDHCKTPYFIQVDEDMILKPGAVRALYETLRRQPKDVFMYAYMLWDKHLVRGIFGVKIYRHDLMRLVPYKDVQSCEQDHFKQLQAMGYRYVVPGWDDATLTPASPQVQGFHGTLYNPRTAFERYLDLTEKYRDVGGSNWYARYPYEFLKRLVGESRFNASRSIEQDTDIWALLGAACGLFSDLSQPRGEKDFRTLPRGFGELRSHLVSPPIEGIIYSTSACNGHCPHCLRTLSPSAQVPDFTLALTKTMLDYYPSLRGVCIAGFGEPTLNKALPDIVNLLRKRNICTGVITNGLHVVDPSGRLVPGLALASYVSFSVNATDAAEHERMYGVSGGWQNVLRGIEAAAKGGVPPTLSFIVTKQTWHRIPEYLKLAHTLIAGVPDARVALVNLLPHHKESDVEAHADFLSKVLTTTDDLSALPEFMDMARSLGLAAFAWPTPIDLGPQCRPSTCQSPFVRLGVDGLSRVSPCSRISPPDAKYGKFDPGTWLNSEGILDLRRQVTGVKPLRWECRHCFGNWSTF